jgi:hypothetical protein
MQTTGRKPELRPQPSNLEVVVICGGTVVGIAGAAAFDSLFHEVTPPRLAPAEGWVMIAYALLAGVSLGWYMHRGVRDAPVYLSAMWSAIMALTAMYSGAVSMGLWSNGTEHEVHDCSQCVLLAFALAILARPLALSRLKDRASAYAKVRAGFFGCLSLLSIWALLANRQAPAGAEALALFAAVSSAYAAWLSLVCPPGPGFQGEE